MAGTGLAGSALLSGTASADDFDHPEPIPGSFTWGSDGTDDWELLSTAAPQGTDEASHRPLYLIAPSGGEHSPHIGGLLDHVVDTPSNGGGTYSANWHVHVVLDVNEDPIPNQPPELPGGPAVFQNPTVSTVESAVANDDDLYEVDLDFQFICPVRPHDGG